jgi:hypothetical protein
MTGRPVGRSVAVAVGRLGLVSAVTGKRPPRFATSAELCLELSL